MYTFLPVAIQLPDNDIWKQHSKVFQPKGIKLSTRPQVRIADLFFLVYIFTENLESNWTLRYRCSQFGLNIFSFVSR